MLRLRKLASLAALILLLAVAAALLGYRHVYNAWPWSSYPNPLHWCGRDYEPQRAQTRAEILKSQPDADFHKAGDVPGWLNSGEIWTTEPGNACLDMVPVILWVKVSDHRFEVMTLEGSP